MMTSGEVIYSASPPQIQGGGAIASEDSLFQSDADRAMVATHDIGMDSRSFQ